MVQVITVIFVLALKPLVWYTGDAEINQACSAFVRRTRRIQPDKILLHGGFLDANGNVFMRFVIWNTVRVPVQLLGRHAAGAFLRLYCELSDDRLLEWSEVRRMLRNDTANFEGVSNSDWDDISEDEDNENE